MSLVYITHHNENVVDYEKVGFVETPIKKLKYISQHKRSVKKQINQPYITMAADGRLLLTDSGKHERRTMGCAKTPLDPPNCFLRKNQGLKWRRLHDHKCPKGIVEMPPVPKVSDIPPKPICKPKAVVTKPKSEETVVAAQPLPVPLAALEIIIVTPREPMLMPAEAINESVCDPCPAFREQKAAPTCDPCEYARKQRETPRATPCMQKLTPKAKPCGTFREKTETPQVKPCETPCRAMGGREKPKDKKLTEQKIRKPIDPCKRTNFIARNIKRMKCAKTKRPEPRYIDTPTGQTHNLINSGLIPQHVCGRNFARVPCYLGEHKKLLKQYREACVTEMMAMQDCSEFIKKQGVRKMSLEERVALLAGLKANYMEQLKIFQTLSLYTDTQTKKLRKGRLEKDLDQLEIDIKFIQDNTDIYVSDF